MAKKTDENGWPTAITDRFTSTPGGVKWINDKPKAAAKKKTTAKKAKTAKKK